MTQDFLFSALIVVALVVFGWRIRKSIQAISAARAKKKSAPLIEWTYIWMGAFLAILFILNTFGVLRT
jgi:hypothetical protein